MKIKSLLATALLSLNAFAGDIIVINETFDENFDKTKWEASNLQTFSSWEGLLVSTDGIALLNDSHEFSNHFDTSLTIHNEQVVDISQGLVFKYKDAQSQFYSAHIMHGQNNSLIINKHSDESDLEGTTVYASNSYNLATTVAHNIKLTVTGDQVEVFLNNFHLDTLTLTSPHDGNRTGLNLTQKGIHNAYVDSFTQLNYSSFEDTFENGVNSNWEQVRSDWTQTTNGITTDDWGWLVSTDSISIKGDFGFEMDWENAQATATTSPYMILDYSEDGSFYSVSVKPGTYGRVSFRSHKNLADGAGTVIKSNPLNLPFEAVFNVKAEVIGNTLTVKLDNEVVLTETINVDPTGNRVGLQVSSVSGNWSIHRIKITK